MSVFQVSITKHPDASSAVRKAIDLLGGMAQFVKAGERVCIKPNGLFGTFREGMVTSPAVVAAVARLVLEAGGKPFIGENDLRYDPASPGFATSCGKVYYDALAEAGLADKVPLVDFMAGDAAEVELPRGQAITRCRIAAPVLQADKLIDVPVLKTHDQVQVSLGIKNLKGTLPLTERIRFHEVNLEQAIVDLCGFLQPDLVVLDGTTGGEGLGPNMCTPVPLELVIAGANALAVDMASAAVMGFDAGRIKYLKYAIAVGMGPKCLEEIDILGQPIAAVVHPFETAEAAACRQYEEMGVTVISQNACSGCWAEFRHIYYSLGEERARLQGVTFALGRLEELPPCEKAVIIGKCAKAVAGAGCYVPGCPPHHFAIDAAARQVSGIGGEPKKLG